jgi:hypothetical protein
MVDNLVRIFNKELENGNKEVLEYINTLKDKDLESRVSDFLETDAGQKLLQPRLDRHAEKHMQSWKKNNLEKLVNEELEKISPPKDSKELEISNLKKEIEKMQNEVSISNKLNEVRKALRNDNIPEGLAEFIVDLSDDVVSKRLDIVSTSFEEYKSTVLKKFDKASAKPLISTSKDINSLDNPNLTLTERAKIINNRKI